MGPHSQRYYRRQVSTVRLKIQSNERLTFFGLCFWVKELNTEVCHQRKERNSTTVCTDPHFISRRLQILGEIFGRKASFYVFQLGHLFAFEGYLT